MKKIFFFGFIIFIVSCSKEKSTSYSAYLKNKTNHKIEIRPYKLGLVISDKIIVLLQNETKQIANGSDRGLNGNVGFTSEYFSSADSVKVIFDQTYSITHYYNTPIALSSKYYLYISLRNLGNYKSFSYSTIDLSKNSRENKYNYEFIEQDYLDAQ